MSIELVKPQPVIESGVHMAYCHNGHASAAWAECYSQFILGDAASRRLIKSKGNARGLYVPQNRNMLVRQFLAHTKCEWLFFLDTDILFETKQFHDLYDAAVENDCDVLGGLYYGFQGDGFIYPTWLEANEREKGQQQTAAFRTGGIQDLYTIGMGFTLIHRRVLKALQEAKPKHTWAWFGHDEQELANGEIDCLGEDTTFCARARKLGFKIQGHSGIAVGHDKQTILTWEKFDQEQVIRRAMREMEESKNKESA